MIAATKYLTPRMLYLETERLSLYYHTKIDNVCLTENPEDENYKFSIIRDRKEKFIDVSYSDLTMSLDDFSERIIKPLLNSMLDWDRAFRMETWV